jgi:uncharacterized protein YjiK/methionine-rich copper-binding protein CopC
VNNLSSTRIALLAAAVLALGLSACGGGGGGGGGSGFGAPGNGNGGGNSASNLSTPTIAFTDPQSTFDLANYSQTGRYSLPVGTGTNLLASEASGITYDKDTGTLFVVGDGGTSVAQVSKQGVLVDSMTLAQDPSKPQGTFFYDTEGITYIGGGKFALVEERFRQVDQFTYVPNTILGAAGAQTVKLGTTIGNIGIEGISYDPKTRGFIAVKESGPSGVFQTNIDFAAGTATNGSPTTDNPANLFDPAQTGLSALNDVFALSNVAATSSSDYDNLLILSAPDGRIVKMDRSGKLLGTLVVGATAQNEGMSMDPGGNIYVVGEMGGGPGKPEMLVFSPTVDKTAVGVGSNLYIGFNQAVKAGTGNIVLSNGEGDVRNIAVTDTTQVSFNGKTVTINPSKDLVAGTAYSVTYAAGVFFDAAGNAAPALASAATLGFTAAGIMDKTPPTLTASSPLDDATGVTNSTITLTFNEAVMGGTGNFVIASTGDTRTIAATDATQVTISGNSVRITPIPALQNGVSYNLQFASGVIKDAAGNAFAGITTPTALNFAMASSAPPVPHLLITEVNSNAAGGDFFELLNTGTAAVDLTGFKWDDDSASFTDAGNATFPSVSIPAGQRLVVVNTTDANAFRTAWGIDGTVPVAAFTGPGLGGGDVVVLFDTTGNVVTSFNYKGGAQIVATDGTVIAPSMASPGVTATLPAHAGLAFGGTSATASAVWDGVSTTAPTYRAAVFGVAGGIAQPSDATAVGSPGQ